MRLIDADALKDALLDENYECHQFCYPCKTILKVIDTAPTVQPDADEWCTDCKEYDQERHSCPRWNRVIKQTLTDARAKGHWIWKTSNRYQCSECGRVTSVDECMGTPMYEVCPYCDADMRGEADETN